MIIHSNLTIGSEPAETHVVYLNGEGLIDINKFLSLVQFYNVDAYQCAEDSEDGFCAGSNRLKMQGLIRNNTDVAGLRVLYT